MNLRLAGIGIRIHSSTPVGTGFQRTGRAWIQYSRATPPGWGCGVGKLIVSTGSLGRLLGRLTLRAAASAVFTSAAVLNGNALPPASAQRSTPEAPSARNCRRWIWDTSRSGAGRLPGWPDSRGGLDISLADTPQVRRAKGRRA